MCNNEVFDVQIQVCTRVYIKEYFPDKKHFLYFYEKI